VALINQDFIAGQITGRSGIELVSHNQTESNLIVFRSEDLPIGRGFIIRVELKWKRIELTFHPETFSSDLVQNMASASESEKRAFSALASKLVKDGDIKLIINNIPMDPFNHKDWEDRWDQVSLLLRTPPLNIIEDIAFSDLKEELIIQWATTFLMILMPLLPIEEIELEIQGELEGLAKESVSKRYERNKKNRSACISFHGTQCKVCEFDFQDQYGKIGEGFIHVHHIVPLSQQGGQYVIDPIRDLVPVCPNCHAMLHKKSPPYSIDELRDEIIKN